MLICSERKILFRGWKLVLISSNKDVILSLNISRIYMDVSSFLDFFYFFFPLSHVNQRLSLVVLGRPYAFVSCWLPQTRSRRAKGRQPTVAHHHHVVGHRTAWRPWRWHLATHYTYSSFLKASHSCSCPLSSLIHFLSHDAFVGSERKL